MTRPSGEKGKRQTEKIKIILYVMWNSEWHEKKKITTYLPITTNIKTLWKTILKVWVNSNHTVHRKEDGAI